MSDFQTEEVGWGELKVAKQNKVHGKKAESSTKYFLMSTLHFNRFKTSYSFPKEGTMSLSLGNLTT